MSRELISDLEEARCLTRDATKSSVSKGVCLWTDLENRKMLGPG